MFSALLTIDWKQTSHLLVAAVAVRFSNCLTSIITRCLKLSQSICRIPNDPKTFCVGMKTEKIICVSRQSAEVKYILYLYSVIVISVAESFRDARYCEP